MNTEQLAAGLDLKADSIRKRLYLTGAYFNLRPVKLPNGRLMWPADSIAKLTGADAAAGGANA